MKIVSVGEILWDVFQDGEHLGGAVFNLAAHSARLGHTVFFVSAVGNDERGRRALARMEELGVPSSLVRIVPDAPTGAVSVWLEPDGQPNFVIHRPAAYDYADLDGEALSRLAAERPDWVTFGTLHQVQPRARALARRLAEANPDARVFYDVNLRRDSYTPELVRDLLGRADVVKLNEPEARELGGMLGLECRTVESFCRENAAGFGWQAVCVTRAGQGCAILAGDEYVERPGFRVRVVDAVGAGDAFSAAFLHALGAGWPVERVADFANRVGAIVASRAGAVPEWSLSDLDTPGHGDLPL